MKKILIVLLLVLTIVSCGPEKKYLNLTLIFDHPLEQENYPEYVADLLMPFSSNKCEGMFAFKPISFMRIDISNKIVKSKFWENLNARTEIENIDSLALSEWIKADFSAKAIPLLTKKGNIIDENKLKSFVDKQKKKKNLVYIYSDSFMDESYEGVPVFSDITELRNDIREKACELGNKKIYILLNPSIGTPPPPPPQGPDIKKLLSEADALYNNKQYDEALAKYNEILQIEPNNSIALQRIREIENRRRGTGTNTKITKLYKYVGGLKNNQPDGQGTMTFLKTGYAPIKGINKHKYPVKAGDQLTGVFKKGYCISGVLYDKNGKKKGVVFGGQ